MDEVNLSSPVEGDERARLITAIGLLVMRWQDATQAFDEEVGRRYGLNLAERHCLSFLWNGPQTASAVAREIHLTPAAVTALIDRLAARDFVERHADPKDRRKVMVAAGAAAKALTEAVYLPMGMAGARTLITFDLAELRAFARVLERTTAVQSAAISHLLASGTVPWDLEPEA